MADRRDMEAAILEGRLGTRLGTRLIDRPKPMAPIAGRPFLEILLNQLAGKDFRHAILFVGHLRRDPDGFAEGD